jgi:hypothetical protein
VIEMRVQIAIFILILAASSPAASNCACSAGGGASYNFLSDPSMDISMDSYDEFLREDVPATGLSGLPDMRKAARSQIILNLDDNSHMDISLAARNDGFFGQGNMTQANETDLVEATGTLKRNRLLLDVASRSGAFCRLDMAKEGSTVLGDYNLTLPNGKNIKGTAAGKWVI